MFTKKYLTSTFPALQRFHLNRLIRGIARQHQQTLPAVTPGSLRLEQEGAQDRYSELYRRLDFKRRVAAELAGRQAVSTTQVGGSPLTELTAFSRGAETTL